MNQNIADSLNATFNVDPNATVTTVTTTSTSKPVVNTTSSVVKKEKKTKKGSLSPEAFKERNEKERRDDLKTSRGAIEKALQTGMDAIDSLYSMAVDSEEPRTYEVLADLIDKIGSTSEKLMKLRREEAEIARIEAKIELDKHSASNETGPKSVTSNTTIFVGDSKELLKHIRSGMKAIDAVSEEIK